MPISRSLVYDRKPHIASVAAWEQNMLPYQHVTEVVRARAEAAGLGVFRAAGARVQAVRGHASHAVKLGQEVCSHALRLGGQVARRLSDDAAEGAAGYSQHWRNKMGEQSAAILEQLGRGGGCRIAASLKRLSLKCENEAASFQAEQPARDTVSDESTFKVFKFTMRRDFHTHCTPSPSAQLSGRRLN